MAIKEFPIEEKQETIAKIEEFPLQSTQETKRTFWQTATTPISKQLTGKSMAERLNITGGQQKDMQKLSTQRGLEGKPLGVAEAFLRQLPSQTIETLINTVDLSPADVAVIATTAGLAKVPFKGIPIGEAATKIPVNKRFFQNIDEFGKYQNWLKTTTPMSSRGIKAITPTIIPKPKLSTPTEGKTITPDFAENINLTKYPEDVRKSISDLVTQKPELGKTPIISDKELITRATNLKDTPTLKYLADLPEGTVESEALKLRMGNVDIIRKALGAELTELKNSLDSAMEQGIGLHRKTASMFGRGLRQQKLPAETQQNMAFAIDNTIKKISKDPIFSKDQELINTVKKLRSMVVDKEFNPTAWNKVYFTWLNSILSNPWTHAVNTGSNTLFAITKLPEKFASAIWDLPLSWKTGKRTQFFGEIPAMVRGALSREPLPQELAMGSKLDVITTPIKGRLGKFIGTPTRLLQVEDDLAKGLVGKMEYAAQQYAGKTGEELTKSVNLEQLYRTFQNDTGALAEAMMFMRGKVPGLRYVIPFIRTPANIIARGLERTPLVAAKIIHKGRIGGYSQEELAKDLGNLTLGTMGAAWIGLQYAKGNVTGKAPSEPSQRDAFYRQGKKPNTIRIGNNWIPLERLEPIGSSFSIIANLIQDYQQTGKEIPSEKIMASLGGLGKTLINKSYLSGFTNLVNTLSDPEMYGKNFLSRISSGAVPQLLKFFADLKDPYYREANTILDQLKIKTPYLSETLPPKLNVFGEPIKKDTFNIGKVSKEPLEKMLEETPISFPGKMIGKEKLIPEEYRWLLQTSGKSLKDKLLRIDPDKFNKLPIEIKEKAVDYLRRKSVEIPRKYLRIIRERNKLTSKNQ